MVITIAMAIIRSNAEHYVRMNTPFTVQTGHVGIVGAGEFPVEFEAVVIVVSCRPQ